MKRLEAIGIDLLLGQRIVSELDHVAPVPAGIL
jgi:hypothetical protein